MEAPLKRRNRRVAWPFHLAGVLAVSLLLGGCGQTEKEGSGNSATETRDVDIKVTKIRTLVGGKLEVVFGKETHVEVTADDNVLPLLKTESRNGILAIRLAEKIVPVTPIVIRVEIPKLEALTSLGGADVNFKNLKSTRLVLKLEGNGSIDGKGTVRDLKCELAGDGQIKTKDLVATSAQVECNGSGEVIVHVVDKLNAVVNGGLVKYHGNPTVDFKMSGSGKVEKAQ